MLFDIIDNLTYEECIKTAKYYYERMIEFDSELGELFEKERYWEDAMADGEPDADERYREVSDEIWCLETTANNIEREYDYWLVQSRAAKERENKQVDVLHDIERMIMRGRK